MTKRLVPCLKPSPLTIEEIQVQQVPVPMHRSSFTNMSRASHSGSSNGSTLFLHNIVTEAHELEFIESETVRKQRSLLYFLDRPIRPHKKTIKVFTNAETTVS